MRKWKFRVMVRGRWSDLCFKETEMSKKEGVSLGGSRVELPVRLDALKERCNQKVGAMGGNTGDEWRDKCT